MSLKSPRSLLLLLSVGTTVLPAPELRACNVPVFRYALERWPADPYDVIVFHDGPLSGEERKLLGRLEGDAEGGRVFCNIRVHRFDLAKQQDEGLSALFSAQRPTKLPWVVVRYPAMARIETPVWAGPLDNGAVQAILDSPARREAARRILTGESAVWVLLECGDKSKDDAAAKLLQTELAKMPELLQLPDPTDAPEDRTKAQGPPLRIAFSLLRVRRVDPAEEFLTKMLVGSEPDLAERSEPLVFPVFGQGRALLALVGAGITQNNIRETAGFLVGACSCEVKRQNPGFDLLMSVDWEGQVGEKLATQTEFRAHPGERVSIPRGQSPTTIATRDSRTATEAFRDALRRKLLMAGAIAAAMLVMVTGMLALRLQRRGRSHEARGY